MILPRSYVFTTISISLSEGFAFVVSQKSCLNDNILASKHPAMWPMNNIHFQLYDLSTLSSKLSDLSLVYDYRPGLTCLTPIFCSIVSVINSGWYIIITYYPDSEFRCSRLRRCGLKVSVNLIAISNGYWLGVIFQSIAMIAKYVESGALRWISNTTYEPSVQIAYIISQLANLPALKR